MKRLVIVYFFSLLFSLTFFVSGVVDSQDGLQYLAVARNIYYKGKPSAPPYELDTRKNIHMPVTIGKDGDSYAFTGLGFSVAMVPAVAITDVVYKIYNIKPSIHFPLENDWLILLCASFTNVFFGALLGTTLFLYLLRFKIPKTQAIVLSLVAIFGTNLFVYTKHIMAHMMFISFMMLSFYLLKLYGDVMKKSYLFFSGVCLGVVVISYNATYLLVLPSYILYYLLLTKPKVNIESIRKLIGNIFIFLLGFIPLFLVYLWFERLRTSGGLGMSSPVFLSNFASQRLLKVPVTIFFEAIYGELLSPGRGFFMYSPILLIILIFWNKLRKKYIPELLTCLLLFLTYIIFYGSLFSQGQPGQGLTALWTGESSWGPRYLTPIIPFATLVVGLIFRELTKIQKLFVFLPLFLVGLYIEILGVLMPYQIKYHDLNRNFVVNQTEFTMYDYVNIIPRYSPILMMSRKLVKLTSLFPQSMNYGPYNVRFWDGIDFPFNVGPERWRVVEEKGYIKFDNPNNKPVNKISFGIINHIMGDTNSVVNITFKINDNDSTKKTITLKPRERIIVDIPVDSSILSSNDNFLEISELFKDKNVKEAKSQILGIISVSINDTNVNIETISSPYVSNLGPAMMGLTYKTYGDLINDPWKYWEIHTQMFERLPDFWWIRNLYYWDITKRLIFTLISFNMIGLITFIYLLKKELINKIK